MLPASPKQYHDHRNLAESGLAEMADDLLRQCAIRFPMSKVPDLYWRKLPRSAGHANHRVWRIVLSCQVIQTEEQLSTTLRHEYAHLLAIDRHGIGAAGHGREWRNCMVEMGLPPERTHRYGTVKSSTRRVVYRCEKCGTLLERNRALARNRIWVHAKCNGRLVFVETKRPAEE